MKRKNLFLSMQIAVSLVLGLAVVSFAATDWKKPAEILSDLTGQPVDDIQAARQNGESYGQQAVSKNVLEAFKQEHIAQVKTRLEEEVAAGRLTDDESDRLLTELETRAEACDGTAQNQGQGGLRLKLGGSEKQNRNNLGGGFGGGRFGQGNRP